MKIFDDFNDIELEKVKKLLLSYENLVELKYNIEEEIKIREQEKTLSMNEKLSTEMLLEIGSLKSKEYFLLKEYNINNLKELKEFDFTKVKEDIPSYMIEDFKFIILCMDFDDYEKREKSNHKK